MSLADALERVRSTGDFAPLLDQVPYARFLNFSVQLEGGEPIGKMAFGEHLVGNANVKALHGGTLGALLELTGVFTLLYTSDTITVPKTVNITVEYLRQANERDTFARATVTRHGRRVANVRILAYQEDESRPVAAAIAHFLLSAPP